MEPVVFIAVLLAACMHASWNAIIKVGIDRTSSMLLLTITSLAICLALIFFFPLPSSAALPWLVASGLVHTGYKIALVRAYEHGDLSQVYPLARGTAPLIVAIVSALALNETTTPIKMLAIVSIGGGVCLMSLRGGTLGRMQPKAFGFALLAAASTASYTLLDGIGARLSDTPSGFIIVLSIVDGIFTCGFVLATRGPSAFTCLLPAWRGGVSAGAMSLAAYWIVVWAFTKAPIALVAALRETSVLFAILIGIVLLKETAGRSRILAAGLITLGVVLMRL